MLVELIVIAFVLYYVYVKTKSSNVVKENLKDSRMNLIQLIRPFWYLIFKLKSEGK